MALQHPPCGGAAGPWKLHARHCLDETVRGLREAKGLGGRQETKKGQAPWITAPGPHR